MNMTRNKADITLQESPKHVAVTDQDIWYYHVYLFIFTPMQLERFFASSLGLMETIIHRPLTYVYEVTSLYKNS